MLNEFFPGWTDCLTYQIFFYWHLKVSYCFALQAPEKLTRLAGRIKSCSKYPLPNTQLFGLYFHFNTYIYLLDTPVFLKKTYNSAKVITQSSNQCHFQFTCVLSHSLVIQHKSTPHLKFASSLLNKQLENGDTQWINQSYFYSFVFLTKPRKNIFNELFLKNTCNNF